MSRLEEVKELNENIRDATEKYKYISTEEARDMGLGFLISLLMRTNEMLAIITEDIEQKKGAGHESS
jgi:hypothetical protein